MSNWKLEKAWKTLGIILIPSKMLKNHITMFGEYSNTRFWDSNYCKKNNSLVLQTACRIKKRNARKRKKWSFQVIAIILFVEGQERLDFSADKWNAFWEKIVWIRKHNIQIWRTKTVSLVILFLLVQCKVFLFQQFFISALKSGLAFWPLFIIKMLLFC